MKNIKFSLILVMLAACIMPSAAKQTVAEATDSLKNILNLAKQGDPTAQNEVGVWYYYGRHTDRNYEEALQWWSKAAQQGNVEAIGNMGLCYQTGHGIAQDSLKAAKLYQQSIKLGNKALFDRIVENAQKGNIFSNMLAASCYKDGIGVKKDAEKAIPFLQAAAEKNCVKAQSDLGLLYLNATRPKEALEWFRKGAENGNLTSTFYCGKILMEGLGMKPEKKEGADYILNAAQKGFPQAMYYLGNCYMEGDGLMQNSEQAVKWYKLAAGKNAANAEWTLAQLYREGKDVPMNYTQALHWYSEAVAQGYGKAFLRLVNDSIPNSPFTAYLRGVKAYTSNNFEEALKEFKTVEKAKVVDGKVMTAVILLNSAYAKNDVKKGAKLMKEAAKTDPQAMYHLATLYETGKGVSKDMAEAVKYLEKAASLDYAPAQCALADMYFEGRGVDQNYSKAINLYEKAYQMGELTETAARRYASCYADGLGMPVDKEKAAEILESVRSSKIDGILKLI